MHGGVSDMPMNSNCDISVIVLGFNGKQFIEGCLDSLLDQDIQADRFEILWADNHSSDDSVKYIKTHYPNIHVLEFGRNHGFAAGNNLAVKYASGNYLVFLNQDTIVHRSWLRELVSVVEQHPELGACQSNMLMPWAEDFENFERHKFPSHVFYTDLSPYGFVQYREKPKGAVKMFYTKFITGAAFIIRRSLLDRLAYVFDPQLNTYSEDLELSLRIQNLGYKLGVATDSVVYHLQYTKTDDLKSSFRKAYLSNRNRFLAYAKNLPTRDFLFYLPKLIIGIPLKTNEFRWGKLKTAIIGISLIPVGLMGLIGAVYKLKMPRIHQ